MSNKIITASPTIWNTLPYKVSVYHDEAEDNHKERHILVQVSRDKESGTISIRAGELLAGNLSRRSINWCVNELLTEENKQRINIMIDNSDFYRLDRTIEVNSHPLPSQPIITAEKTPTWEDKQIKDVKHMNDYVFMFWFKDGTIKIMDIEPYIRKHIKLFEPMIKDKNIARNVQIEPMGTGIYWNDIMDMEAEYIYNNSQEVNW